MARRASHRHFTGHIKQGVLSHGRRILDVSFRPILRVPFRLLTVKVTQYQRITSHLYWGHVQQRRPSSSFEPVRERLVGRVFREYTNRGDLTTTDQRFRTSVKRPFGDIVVEESPTHASNSVLFHPVNLPDHFWVEHLLRAHRVVYRVIRSLLLVYLWFRITASWDHTVSQKVFLGIV